MANNYCEKCGTKLAPGAKFCAKCGHPVGKKESSNSQEDTKKPKEFKQTFGMKEEEYDQMVSKEPVKEEDLTEKDKKLVGVNGWLILFTIGVFFSIFIIGGSELEVFKSFSQADPSFTGYLVFASIGNAVIICLMVSYLITLFFKLKVAKTLAITFLILDVALVVADAVITSGLYQAAGQEVPQDIWSTATRVIFFAAIWIPYFFSSKRVKLTLTK